MLDSKKIKSNTKKLSYLICVYFITLNFYAEAATQKTVSIEDQPGFVTDALAEDKKEALAEKEAIKEAGAKNNSTAQEKKDKKDNKANQKKATTEQSKHDVKDKTGSGKLRGRKNNKAGSKTASKNTWLPEMGENPDSSETKQKKEQQRAEEEKLVNDLSNLNYNTFIAPPELYNIPRSGTNSHIPPVYFQSDYLKMIINSIDKSDFNNLRTLIDNYQFINEPYQNGDTLLMYSILNRRLNCARILLTHGADVNALNVRQRTALHYAAALGDVDSIKLLLSMGANINVIDDVNMLPIDYARVAQQAQAEMILSKYLNNE